MFKKMKRTTEHIIFAAVRNNFIFHYLGIDYVPARPGGKRK